MSPVSPSCNLRLQSKQIDCNIHINHTIDQEIFKVVISTYGVASDD